MAYSKSAISNERRCFLSHREGDLVIHHCMLGNGNREKATDDGLWVWLDPKVHIWLHSAKGTKKLKELRRIAQIAYEKEHTHEEWMERYHKNYV